MPYHESISFRATEIQALGKVRPHHFPVCDLAVLESQQRLITLNAALSSSKETGTASETQELAIAHLVFRKMLLPLQRARVHWASLASLLSPTDKIVGVCLALIKGWGYQRELQHLKEGILNCHPRGGKIPTEFREHSRTPSLDDLCTFGTQRPTP